MQSRHTTKLFTLILLTVFSILHAQVPEALSVYQNHAYYLAKEMRLLRGVYYKAKNPHGELILARPGFFISLKVQEDFFQDSPAAIREIDLLKRVSKIQMIHAMSLHLIYSKPNTFSTIRSPK